jgi:signal transduction histidine kinase
VPASANGAERARGNEVAQRTLQQLLGLFECTSGVLFEQPEPYRSDFVIAAYAGRACTPPADLAVHGQCLLPRWLRVNQRALPIPDSIGVVDSLAAEDRDSLDTLGVSLAVPLLVDANLVAWGGLCLEHPSDGRPRELSQEIDAIARCFRDERDAALERSRAEAVARSHRLGVAGQMAAGIAHEVRNPLAAVRSMVQLVRSEVAPPNERNRLLDTAMLEIDRVNRGLSGMMSLGRPSASRSDRVDLASVVTEAAGFCRAYAKQKNQTLDVQASESLLVTGDQHELRQVVVNLLMNACQASAASQTISVDAASKPGDGDRRLGVVRIMDPGHGIPPEQLSRVFEPFFTTKADGGGLGLAICREAIQRHGGDIMIASQVGTGTTVSLELPLLTLSDGPNLSC